jgi:hypothetical protein
MPVDIHKKVIPFVIVKVFRKGWKIGFPINILTPIFLDLPDVEQVAKAVVKATSNPSSSGPNHNDARTALNIILDEPANPPTMVRRPVVSGDPRQVSTPLILDNWETEIQALGLESQFSDVPQGLRNGFRIGASGQYILLSLLQIINQLLITRT